MEIYDLPDREFKVKIIKMLSEVRKTTQQQNKNFNVETENIF